MDLHSLSSWGERRRGDGERGKRTCVRKVNLFGAWVIWLKNHCVHLICSSEAGAWSWEIVVGWWGRGLTTTVKRHWSQPKWQWKSCATFGRLGDAPPCYVTTGLSVWSGQVGFISVEIEIKDKCRKERASAPTVTKVASSKMWHLTPVHFHWILLLMLLFLSVESCPPLCYILLPPSPTITHPFQHIPTGQQWKLTFRNTRFFPSLTICAPPWEMRKETGEAKRRREALSPVFTPIRCAPAII